MDKIDQFKKELVSNGYLGGFHTDYPKRLINATDNSIYEIMPLAVASPQNYEDLYTLIKTANLPAYNSLSLTARGGGTGTNGQSLTNGIVVDLSVYMNKILDFNLEEMTVTVEPGVILSDLNRFLLPYGVFFAPNVSTENRATIGGMIATDAAGKGSLIYGKTIDSLQSLKVILADGYVINTESMDVEQLKNLDKEDRLFGIYSNLIKLLDPVQDEISKRFPVLKRPLSGYNIKRCYQGSKIDLTPLFAGSEGTLGIVASAKLKLLRIPKHRTMVVIHYSSFIEALRDAKNLIRFQPLAVEAIDEKVQKSAQSLPNWSILAKWLKSEGQNYISNFVEFVANDAESLAVTITQLEKYLATVNANYVVITDNNQINQLWGIRSLAVGLAGKIPGSAKPVAFIEDAIVPPENLADFVADLQQELEDEGLKYAMYGHVDVGCIHVRPALDLQQPQDRNKIRPLTEIVIKLLTRYNGILWGEHGKGFRGEFVPEVFGPVLYPILCQIKHLFDPNNRLNPGKLAAPSPELALDRIEQVPMRGQFDQMIPKIAQQEFIGSIICNGNGACFNKEPSNVMCPSYKVTGDRIHSPKGRAMLVKEWLREKSKPHGQHKAIADMAFQAMQGCLGCKGCSGKCPTQVSIPDLRTKFLDNYHKQYKKRDLRDISLAYIEHLLPIFAKFPRSWNFVNRFNVARFFGLQSVPVFKSGLPLAELLKQLDVVVYNDPSQIKSMPERSVVIFADVFTGFLDNEVLVATINVLKNLGYVLYIIYPRPSGKSLIVAGLIDKFKKNSSQLAELFNPLFEANIKVIGLENTITLMFRDEVAKFANSFHSKVHTLAEFLSDNLDNLGSTYRIKEEYNDKYILLPHCTEQAILPGESQLWRAIFARFNIVLDVQNLGCCGMAGAYGYQMEHKDNSRKLFGMSWQNVVSDTESKFLATGFSCRSQSEKILRKNILHPIRIISKLIE